MSHGSKLGHIGHTVHTAHHVKEIVEDLPRLPNKKNPVIAALFGLTLGAVGVGLYFRNWEDLLLCLGLNIALMILLPGLGIVLGWLFAPVYAYYRAVSSNEKHD